MADIGVLPALLGERHDALRIEENRRAGTQIGRQQTTHGTIPAESGGWGAEE